jgi:hypothetical protein
MSRNESFLVRVLGGQLSGVLAGGGYALVSIVISQMVLACVLKRFMKTLSHQALMQILLVAEEDDTFKMLWQKRISIARALGLGERLAFADNWIGLWFAGA